MGNHNESSVIVRNVLKTFCTASKKGYAVSVESKYSERRERATLIAVFIRQLISKDHVVCIKQHTVKKVSRNSDEDNSGANQTTWGSENSYSHVVWFCATVVNIGIWRIPTWLFLQCNDSPAPRRVWQIARDG